MLKALDSVLLLYPVSSTSNPVAFDPGDLSDNQMQLHSHETNGLQQKEAFWVNAKAWVVVARQAMSIQKKAVSNGYMDITEQYWARWKEDLTFAVKN